MALQASVPSPFYGFTGKGSRSQRKLYLNAVFSGYRRDYEPLTRFFVEAIERAEKGLERTVNGEGGRFNPRAPSKTLDS